MRLNSLVKISDYLANYDHRLFAGTIQTNIGNHYYIFEDGRFLLVNPAKDEPINIIFEESKAELPAIVDEGSSIELMALKIS